MAITDGINGIPVKIKKGTNDFEMIFLSSFRKCPKLKKMSRDFVKLTILLEKYAKLEKSYSAKLIDIDPLAENHDSEVDRLTEKSMEMVDKIGEGAEEITELTHNYIIASLMGAGYTKAQAVDIELRIPQDRFYEILSATRTGATKALDFFTEELPQAQN